MFDASTLVAPTAASPGARRIEQAAELAARHFAVTVVAIRRRRRGTSSEARARQVAIYLAHVSCGLPQAEVAEFFRCDRRHVGYSCRAVEDLRDDPAFEAALNAFEVALARGVRR